MPFFVESVSGLEIKLLVVWQNVITWVKCTHRNSLYQSCNFSERENNFENEKLKEKKTLAQNYTENE